MDGCSVGDRIEREELLRDLCRALAIIDKRTALIIDLRFGLTDDVCSLREVGEALGISGNRVRQLETRGLRKIYRRGKVREMLRCHL